jgi:hypothetical protein
MRGLAIAAGTLLAMGCGDDEVPATSQVPSTILSTVPTVTTPRTTKAPSFPPASTGSDTAAMSSATTTPPSPSASTSIDVAADPVAGVLATAAADWLSWQGAFTTVHVVDRLGQERADLPSNVEFSDDARPMTDLQRSAIAAALAPRVVAWVHDLESVAGTAMTVPSDEAVVMFAEPSIEGALAEVVVNLWCGMACGGGVTLVLERSGEDWAVTERLDDFVA